jgi:hypothetical protein
MKTAIISIIIFIGFMATLYFWDQKNKQGMQHPEIHSQAGEPDSYLLEAVDFESQHRHAKSAIKIEQAIEAIWQLEKEIDDSSFDRLESTISKLENVHRRIVRDSIPYDELLSTFEYALGNLANVELAVAAKYSASKQSNEARTAIKYAQLHIKNLLVLHGSSLNGKSLLLESEIKVLNEIDQVLADKNLGEEESIASIDKMIKEVDAILDRIEEN